MCAFVNVFNLALLIERFFTELIMFTALIPFGLSGYTKSNTYL